MTDRRSLIPDWRFDIWSQMVEQFREESGKKGAKKGRFGALPAHFCGFEMAYSHGIYKVKWKFQGEISFKNHP
jgi:hypothetical protein